MSGDDSELVTQQRVLQLFREKLKYKYIGNLREQLMELEIPYTVQAIVLT